jgi:hypothetical protein
MTSFAAKSPFAGDNFGLRPGVAYRPVNRHRLFSNYPIQTSPFKLNTIIPIRNLLALRPLAVLEPRRTNEISSGSE